MCLRLSDRNMTELCTHRPASEQGAFGCRMLHGMLATGHVTSHRPRAGWPIWTHMLSYSVRNKAKDPPPIMSDDQRGQTGHPVERGWGSKYSICEQRSLHHQSTTETTGSFLPFLRAARALICLDCHSGATHTTENVLTVPEATGQRSKCPGLVPPGALFLV